MLDLEDLIDEFYIFEWLILRICNDDVGGDITLSLKYPQSAPPPRLMDCNCVRSIEISESIEIQYFPLLLFSSHGMHYHLMW